MARNEFECKVHISSTFNVEKNAFVKYGELQIEGNPERLGMLLKHIADKEPALKAIVDIAAGVKVPGKTTKVNFDAGSAELQRPDSKELSDEEIKEQIRANNARMND